MATIGVIPLSGINFEVFASGNRFLGLAEVSLPDLEFSNVDMSGAGIAGDFQAVVKGFVKSAEMELTWHTINKDLSFFAEHRAKDLQLYEASENYHTSTGEFKAEQVKIALRGFNKKINFGTLKSAEQTETKTTLEILYMQVTVGGKVVIEFDKINYKFIVDGVDYLADVRTALNI